MLWQVRQQGAVGRDCGRGSGRGGGRDNGHGSGHGGGRGGMRGGGHGGKCGDDTVMFRVRHTSFYMAFLAVAPTSPTCTYKDVGLYLGLGGTVRVIFEPPGACRA